MVLTAQTFHQRPSELLAIDDPVIALELDFACAGWARVHGKEQNCEGGRVFELEAPVERAPRRVIRLGIDY